MATLALQFPQICARNERVRGVFAPPPPTLTRLPIVEARMASISLCSVDGCGKASSSKGLCRNHYGRLRKHGDPTGGRNALEGVRWLECHVGYAADACLLWPFGGDQKGYGKVTHPFSRRAHRVMCLLAHGEPPIGKFHAAHGCGNTSCVNPRHLRWATVRENQMDRVLHGTSNRGERHPSGKLTEEAVRHIRGNGRGDGRQALAERYGVTPDTINRVQRGERWAWLV